MLRSVCACCLVSLMQLATRLTAATPARPHRPHIVMVLGDDVGSADVGYHGQPPATTGLAAQTPVIDRLARTGVRLSSHYVRNWCAPTRAMILSGRYQLHYDKTGGGGTGHTNGLPLNFTLLPEALAKEGYVSAFIGKWHLGEAEWAQTPHHRGFRYSLGYFGGQEDYYLHNVAAEWPNGSSSTEPLPMPMKKTCNPSTGDCKCDIIDLWQSSPTSQGPAPVNLTGEYSMYFYTRRAVDFIRQQAARTAADSGSRLFLYFASQLIHDPHQVPQRFIDMYPSTAGAGGCPADDKAPARCACCSRRVVLAMMSCLDETVSNITQALETTGLMSNTLFVFASDNGGVVADDGSNVPLRGGKFSDWEGGVRSPAFLAGPLIPQRARGLWYNGIISATDWSVTFILMAGALNANASMGAKVGTVPPLDGVDMWGAVAAVGGTSREQAAAVVRSETWIETGKLRMGEWKLIIRNCGGRGLTGTGGGWVVPATNITKPYPNQTSGGNTAFSGDSVDQFLVRGCNLSHPCLYHVGGQDWNGSNPYANDAIEAVNLAGDPAQLHRLAQMRARLAQLETTAWAPDNGRPGDVAVNNGRCCDQAIQNGGVLGPWLGPIGI